MTRRALETTSANAPQGFALSQNLPNPFTPVATIVSGMHETGSYQAQIDAGGLPAGLYYYTMRAGGFSATRSMTINKMYFM